MILVRDEIHLQSAGVVLNAHKSRNKIIRKVTCQKRKRSRQNSPLRFHGASEGNRERCSAPSCSAELPAAACRGPTAQTLQSSRSRCSLQGQQNGERGNGLLAPVLAITRQPPASAPEHGAGSSSRRATAGVPVELLSFGQNYPIGFISVTCDLRSAYCCGTAAEPVDDTSSLSKRCNSRVCT